MESIVIHLSGEPRGKGRPRFNRKTGFAYTPTPTRNYEAALRMAMHDAYGGRPPMEGPLKVVVEAVFTVPASWSGKKRAAALAGAIRPTGRPDGDNLLKCCDPGNKLLWHDDSQIVDARVVKLYGEAAYLRIEVTPLSLADAVVPASRRPERDLFQGSSA